MAFPVDARSDVQRLDYSSGTGSIVTTGKLTEKLTRAAGTSNSSYGWIRADIEYSISQYGTYHSSVHRIDFANDTVEVASNLLNENDYTEGNKLYGTAFNAAANGAT